MAIRLATEADIPAILSIYSPYIINTTVTFEYDVPSLKEFIQRFREITAQFPWLVWEQDGQILGYAYASAPFQRAAYAWCAEPSIYLAPQAHRRGIGKQLYTVLENLLQLQGYRLLYAIITQDNLNSVAFHTALGYRHLASFPRCAWKFGRCLGITWMEKTLNFVESSSLFPKPFPDIVNNVENFTGILGNLSIS